MFLRHFKANKRIGQLLLDAFSLEYQMRLFQKSGLSHVWCKLIPRYLPSCQLSKKLAPTRWGNDLNPAASPTPTVNLAPPRGVGQLKVIVWLAWGLSFKIVHFTPFPFCYRCSRAFPHVQTIQDQKRIWIVGHLINIPEMSQKVTISNHITLNSKDYPLRHPVKYVGLSPEE